MVTPKRSTIYFDPDLHRAARLKAAATDVSISDVVNEEDAADLETLDNRRRERTLDFGEIVATMRRGGKL